MDTLNILTFEKSSNVRALGLRRIFNRGLVGGAKARPPKWTYPNHVKGKKQMAKYRTTHYKNGRLRPQKTKPLCAICLKNFTRTNKTQLECGDGKHAFHTECICAWLLKVNTCPLCRTPVNVASFCPLDGVDGVLTGHTSFVTSVAFSPNGQFLVSGSGDKSVRLWNIDSGEVQVFKGHTDWVSSVAFSPNGQFLVSGSLDKSVRLWNIDSGEVQVLEGHTGRVGCVACWARG